jgi:hypothetical protein
MHTKTATAFYSGTTRLTILYCLTEVSQRQPFIVFVQSLARGTLNRELANMPDGHWDLRVTRLTR